MGGSDEPAPPQPAERPLGHHRGRAGERPADFAPGACPVEADPARPCPFCPGNEEATPPALETYGRDGSLATCGSCPTCTPRSPATSRWRSRNLGPVFTCRRRPAASTRCWCSRPTTTAAGPTSTTRGAGLVMAAMRDRMEEHARTPNVRYTQAIVNHGREAGASLAHPHGQLLGMPFVPGEIVDEERRRSPASRAGCLPVHDRRGRAVRRPPRRAGRRRRVRRRCARSGAARPTRCSSSRRTHEGHLQPAPPATSPRWAAPSATCSPSCADVVGDVAYNLVFHTAPHHQTTPVPLARPRAAPAGDDGRLRAGHRRAHQHRRPRSGRAAAAARSADPSATDRHDSHGSSPRRRPSSTRRPQTVWQAVEHVDRHVDWMADAGRHPVHVGGNIRASAPRSTATRGRAASAHRPDGGDRVEAAAVDGRAPRRASSRAPAGSRLRRTRAVAPDSPGTSG